MLKKAVILARVSTKEQEEEGHSLPAQVRRLQEYAQKKGFEVVKDFVFSESAGNKIRIKFLEMLEFIKKNKDVKVILCQNVDRITRNFKDAVDLDEMRIKENLEIHFVQDGFFLNRESTGNQMFMWEAKVFLGKQYLNRLSDDVKRSNEQKILSGEWTSKAPIGYTNIVRDDGKKHIILDFKRVILVKKLFEWYSAGNCSIDMLRGKAKQEGLTVGLGAKDSLSKGQINKILNNPFYYGEMLFKGKLYSHNYELIIMKELFEKVKRIKQGYNKKPFKHKSVEVLFRGLLRCKECGCAISFIKKKKFYKETNRHATYIYGACTNSRKVHEQVIWIREEDLISQINDLFKQMVIPDDKLEYLKLALQKSHEDKKEYHKTALTTLKTEYEKIQNRISVLYEDRLDKRISVETYDTKVASYKQKQIEITKQIELHTHADAEYYNKASQLLDVASRAHEIFRGSETDEKHELMKFLFLNLTLNEEIIEFTLRKPFDTIFEHVTRQLWCPRRDLNPYDCSHAP